MAQAMRKPTACHSSKLRCRLRGAYLAYALVPLYESPTIRSEVAAGSQRMPLTDDKNKLYHSLLGLASGDRFGGVIRPVG
jgi:hypothetical protein